MEKSEKLINNYLSKQKQLSVKSISPNFHKFTDLYNMSTQKNISNISPSKNFSPKKITSFEYETEINYESLIINEFLYSKDLAMEPIELSDNLSFEENENSPKIKKKLFEDKNNLNVCNGIICPFCNEIIKNENSNFFNDIFFEFFTKIYLKKIRKEKRCKINHKLTSYNKSDKKHTHKIKSEDFNNIKKQKTKKLKSEKKVLNHHSKLKLEKIMEDEFSDTKKKCNKYNNINELSKSLSSISRIYEAKKKSKDNISVVNNSIMSLLNLVKGV